ncbi:MAG: hypothetical protein FK730_13410 [Asgard group archaeon]|nr:hypothetical protein [Asgard group archaeon]
MVSVNFDDDYKNQIKNSHKIISSIFYEINKDEVKINFEQIQDLQDYNTIRKNIIDSINDKFITPIIEKGLKRDYHKVLIKNNKAEFNQFLERKIRYLIADLLRTGELQLPLEIYNTELFYEIKNNSEMMIVTADESKRKLFLKTVNDYILLSNKSNLPKKIVSFLLTKVEYKEKIVEFINEFLKYLIIF